MACFLLPEIIKLFFGLPIKALNIDNFNVLSVYARSMYLPCHQ